MSALPEDPVITILGVCSTCGQSNSQFLAVTEEGCSVATRCPCHPKHAQDVARAAELRRLFASLLDETGGDRVRANEMLSERIWKGTA